MRVAYAELETPDTVLGRLLVAGSERGICYTSLRGDGEAMGRLRDWGRRNEPAWPLVPFDAARDPVLAAALDELERYAAGSLTEFSVALDLRGSGFQRRVWEALRGIPYGETHTYGEVAAALGQPGASRAVGAANGRNPVPVIVPCHRVVARDGLGGFTGGLHHKRRLLDFEGVHVVG